MFSQPLRFLFGEKRACRLLRRSKAVFGSRGFKRTLLFGSRRALRLGSSTLLFKRAVRRSVRLVSRVEALVKPRDKLRKLLLPRLRLFQRRLRLLCAFGRALALRAQLLQPRRVFCEKRTCRRKFALACAKLVSRLCKPLFRIGKSPRKRLLVALKLACKPAARSRRFKALPQLIKLALALAAPLGKPRGAKRYVAVFGRFARQALVLRRSAFKPPACNTFSAMLSVCAPSREILARNSSGIFTSALATRLHLLCKRFNIHSSDFHIFDRGYFKYRTIA